ncbi:MAG: transketolase C-terminal domain-containing protein, partial [Terrimesophilobacter sp.]
HRLVVCIEDGVRVGGIGTRVRQDLRDAGIDTAVTELGLPDEFLPHGSRSELLELAGLTAKKIALDVVDQVLGNRIPIARPLPDEGTSKPDLRLVDTSDGRSVEGRPERSL